MPNTQPCAAERGFFNCLLPDGRNVNILTQPGADAFIGHQTNPQNPFNGFSSNLSEVDEILQKRTKPTRQETEKIKMIYIMLGVIADNATPAVFERISKSELVVYFDHVTKVLQPISTDSRWKRTGRLPELAFELINCTVPLMMHFNAVQAALTQDYFGVLAKLIAARAPPTLPEARITSLSCGTFNNARITLSDSKRSLSSIKVFQTFEACGMLGQFIRCATMPEAADQGMYMCFDDLLGCQQLLKKKFIPGEACGDIVCAILAGKDGDQRRSKKITEYLRNIMSMAKMMQPANISKSQTGLLARMCRNCNASKHTAEFQRNLLVCSRCAQTYYCSKDCQKADWKRHKPTCVPRDKDFQKQTGSCQNMTLNFAQQNYTEIMIEILSVCDSTGLCKNDLLIEVDCHAGKDGSVAPALQRPAKFKIGPARRYFEGSRPDEPDWFYKGQDEQVYKTNVTPTVSSLKDQFERMTDNHILCFLRHTGGVAVNRVQFTSSPDVGGKHMFSYEALDAFRSAVQDEDFGPMSRIFDDDQLAHIKSKIGGMPTENEIDAVRRMLNMNFGADFDLSGAGLDH